MRNIEMHHILGSDPDSELGLFLWLQGYQSISQCMDSLNPYSLNEELLILYLTELKAVAL